VSILVTGASGFVGSALIQKLISQGHTVYGLSRKPLVGSRNLIPIVGDILLPDLGIENVLGDIDAVYHLAAKANLGKDIDGSIWHTNVEGTKNVIDFCLKYRILHLYFCSSAYAWPINVYGQSKIACESYIKDSEIPEKTIFKPSIILPSYGNYFAGHFSQFVMLTINTLAKVRATWRKIEETLRLPVLLEPVLRIKGNPEGKLNLVKLDQVIEGMSNIQETGTFWLTNTDPPTVQQLGDWIGDYIMVKMKVMSEDFTRMPAEVVFDRKIAAFKPYLQGHNLPSDLKDCPPLSREFIQDIVKKTILD
jgi:nucleoside-diphosphate-sugar epimerase